MKMHKHKYKDVYALSHNIIHMFICLYLCAFRCCSRARWVKVAQPGVWEPAPKKVWQLEISSQSEETVAAPKQFLGAGSHTPGCATFTHLALLQHLNAHKYKHINMCIILCDNAYTSLYLCLCIFILPPYKLNSDKWTRLITQDSAQSPAVL
jgi:hypothetical protein